MFGEIDYSQQIQSLPLDEVITALKSLPFDEALRFLKRIPIDEVLKKAKDLPVDDVASHMGELSQQTSHPELAMIAFVVVGCLLGWWIIKKIGSSILTVAFFLIYIYIVAKVVFGF